jgi:hypothetical protein
MEQMLIWAFVHREFARMYREPMRSDDAFYESGIGAVAARERSHLGWKLSAALRSGRTR